MVSVFRAESSTAVLFVPRLAKAVADLFRLASYEVRLGKFAMEALILPT